MRGAGLAMRRLTKPPSMSRASVIPALMPAKPAPITVASGIVNARYEAPPNTGSCEMPRKAPAVETRMNSGMISDGRNTDGIRRTRIRLRNARPQLTDSVCLTAGPPAAG